MTLGLDYSAGAIAGQTIKAAGFDFVIRYCDAPANVTRKCITPAEHADLKAAGVDVFLVHEQWTTDMDGGYAAGVAHAQRAVAGANWVGYTGPIFMAADEHLTAAGVASALQYLRGAATVIPVSLLGVYGFPELIQAAQQAGVASWFWQCGSAPKPGTGVHIWQRNYDLGQTIVGGVQCDVDELLIPLPSGSTSEDAVSLIDFPATPLPSDVGGKRWQDTDPSGWAASSEQKTALVAAGPNTWRGNGSLSSITCGWAYGYSNGPNGLADATITAQDGPDANGLIKPSGFVEYLRVFYFPDGPGHGDWRVVDLLDKVALIGNKSLPSIQLPPFCTFLVCRYAAPGGLYLGIEYQH